MVSQGLWRVAVHEAGHAVAAKAMGVEVCEAIADDDEGHVIHRDTSLLRKLIIIRASLSAERIVGGFREPGSRDQDRADENRLLRNFSELARGAVRLTVASVADDIIRANRENVKKVADLLCEYESADDELMRQALRNVKTFDVIERERALIRKSYKSRRTWNIGNYGKQRTVASVAGCR